MLLLLLNVLRTERLFKKTQSLKAKKVGSTLEADVESKIDMLR
jgi:hypothetical protein